MKRLEIEQISPNSPLRGKASEQENVQGPSSQRRHPLPSALGSTSWQMEARANAGQTKMVPRQARYCLERKKGNICECCLGAEQGQACCFSSQARGGLAPDRSERFPETNASERYFPSPYRKCLCLVILTTWAESASSALTTAAFKW